MFNLSNTYILKILFNRSLGPLLVKMITKQAFYSIPAAAQMCGVSRATMWNWVKSGKVDAFVTPGGHSRIRREEMDRLLEANGFARDEKPVQKRILIVDDDPAVRKVIGLRLDREGYRVTTAENGFEAGIMVSQQRPDLVLLDLFMEGIDGFEVCRTIKSDDNLKPIKVLAISGVNDDEIEQRILAEGADGFLSKQARFETVLSRIKTLLNQI